jgi:hypothetical protein
MAQKLEEFLGAGSGLGGCCLHLIDIENLAGTGKLDMPAVRAICAKYVNSISCSIHDVFLIAAGPQNRVPAFDGWYLGQRVFKFQKGTDGADEALRALFQQISDLKSFEHVYLASGDHGLFSIAKKSKDIGLKVTIVTGRGRLSRTFKRYDHIQMELNTNE